MFSDKEFTLSPFRKLSVISFPKGDIKKFVFKSIDPDLAKKHKKYIDIKKTKNI